MQIKSLKLQNFRNIDFASIQFTCKNQFLVGLNAQGKTNLVESIGFISALRSFRTQETVDLIKRGEKEAQLVFELEHETIGQSELMIKIQPKSKEILLDGEKLNKLSDLMGLFPTVVISSHDIQLLRSSPQHRRRFIDITLSTVNKNYFQLLKRYYRILKNRNNLFKADRLSEESLVSFDKLFVPDALELIVLRKEMVSRLEEIFQHTYRKISQSDESPRLVYEPNVKVDTQDAYFKLLLENRERDKIMKSTQRGLHRDDISIQLDNTKAKNYSSEGQQKNLVIALKLAQMQFYGEELKISPIFLADDILGELDEVRRSGFWELLNFSNQVIATGVDLPDDKHIDSWDVIKVCSGSFDKIR